MDFIKLIEDPLNVNEIYSQVVCHSTGAVSMFVGTTRDHFENKKVTKLEYEAYVPMAEKEIQKICQSIREKWKVEHIAFYHRLGHVPVGEASVVLAISSEHRAESLEATQYGINELKKSVPIWKKEVYDQGAGEWKANAECMWAQKNQRRKSDEQKRKMDCENENYVQIKASKTELEHRIKAFVERKRSELDVVNVQEFCHRLPFSEGDQSSTSCARTDSVLVSRKDSKSHLRVSRVVNTVGPQTQAESSRSSEGPAPLPGIEERLRNMEQHLGLLKDQPVPRDVYARLKQLEDRILYLESVSPEYLDGDLRLSARKNDEEMARKIDQRIAELRRKIRQV